MARLTKRCISCGCTGWLLLNRSWFSSDGYRRKKCDICAGTGVSAYRDDPVFVRLQAGRRALQEGGGE